LKVRKRVVRRKIVVTRVGTLLLSRVLLLVAGDLVPLDCEVEEGCEDERIEERGVRK
jgi:hypothetical protein